MTRVSEAVQRLEHDVPYLEDRHGADIAILLASHQRMKEALEKIKSRDCETCTSDLIAFAALSDDPETIGNLQEQG